MHCKYCNKIEIKKRNIHRVEEILEELSSVDSSNDSVSSELASFSQNCFTGFTCINMSDLESEENKLNKDVINDIPCLRREAEDKLEELNNELSALKREDKKYHEKHHKHSDD